MTGIGTWVTERIVAPRLSAWSGGTGVEGDEFRPLTPEERRGLRFAG